uniref:T9SS type B sorting domain-containing protein n=1 Tax=uncultured Maribacter sp. TaxID=431308 RepID=UPI0026292F87
TVTYTTAGTCPNSSTESVTINALDDATFSYAAAAYCVDAADPTPTATLAGGSYASTAGLSINASTGAIDVSASTPSTYTVTYTTAGTCPNSSTESVTINALDDATFSYAAAAYCVDAADPTPTATLAGGSYASTAGLSINASTGAIDVSASTPGTYTITYTTAGTCPNSSTESVTINALPTITVSTAATCSVDLLTYSIIIDVSSGGVVTSTSGTVTDNGSDNWTIDAITSGTDITITVTDGNSCDTTLDVTAPDFALQVSYTVTDVACSGGNDGVLEIIATGGTGIIKYAISPQLNQFFETAIFEDLPAGTYQAIAQDELGCFVLIDFVIDQPDPVILSLVPNSIIPEVCIDELDGDFSVDLTGGNLPYSLSLDDINGTYTTGTLTQTQFDFTGLAGGDHIVYVRDNLGCESEWNITFPESVRIVTELDITYCTDNLNDASINMVTAMVDDTLVDLTDLDYSLDGGTFQSDNTFMDILPGNHFITVRHTNTCESIIDFEIEQFDPLQLVIAEGSINEIIASSTGGSGVYEYEVQFENSSSSEFLGSTSTFPIYESGNYTITVTDSNGCVAVATAFFEYIDVCITNYFTPNNDGRQDEWGPGCTDQYPNLTVNIFDRYGREVSKLRVSQKWDGKYNGVELPSGDYWYVVKLNDQRDNREFVGHFTLYR